MKKILVVYPHLPHYRFGVFQKMSLSKRYEFEFAAGPSSRDGSIPCLTANDVERFAALRNTWIGPILWQHGLLRLISSGRFDGVIFLGDASHASTWAATILCRLRRIKTFFWTIGWHRVDKGPKRNLRNLFYRLADGLMLYGYSGIKLGLQNGFTKKNAWVIGNSQESKLNGSFVKSELEVSAFIAALPTSPSPKIGAVVRLNRVKRLDLLLEAIALLRSQDYDFEVLLIGEGPAREELHEQAKRLGVPLFMPGAAYDEREISAAYELISVTVIPVWAGLSAVQSLTHGRPVVTTDDICQQAPESECIRDGITGMFFEEGSIESLAECILACHKMRIQNPDKFEEAAKEELNSRWTSDAHALAIETVLDKYFSASSGIRAL